MKDGQRPGRCEEASNIFAQLTEDSREIGGTDDVSR